MRQLHIYLLSVIGMGNIGCFLLKCLMGTGVPANHLVIYDNNPSHTDKMS